MALMTIKTSLKIALTTLFIISNTVNAINSVCHPTSNRALCSIITKNATTWSEAMTNAINYELDYVKAGKPIIDGVGSKLPENIDPKLKQKAITSCRRNYENVVSDLNMCLKFVKSDPHRSLSVVIDFQNWKECNSTFFFDHIPVPSDLANYAKHFAQSNDILLSLSRLTA